MSAQSSVIDAPGKAQADGALAGPGAGSGRPAPGTPPSEAAALEHLPTVLRPHRNLLVYLALSSLLFGPLFVFALVPFYFRYHTLRYELDHEGITARWGILFRREISLTYARIQDIHLSSNVVERWLGLARIQIQTASGSSSAEMTLSGLRDSDAMRDFLYSRMRGARQAARAGLVDPRAGAAALDELAATLREVAAELRAIRHALPPTGRTPNPDV